MAKKNLEEINGNTKRIKKYFVFFSAVGKKWRSYVYEEKKNSEIFCNAICFGERKRTTLSRERVRK